MMASSFERYAMQRLMTHRQCKDAAVATASEIISTSPLPPPPPPPSEHNNCDEDIIDLDLSIKDSTLDLMGDAVDFTRCNWTASPTTKLLNGRHLFVPNIKEYVSIGFSSLQPYKIRTAFTKKPHLHGIRRATTLPFPAELTTVYYHLDKTRFYATRRLLQSEAIGLWISNVELSPQATDAQFNIVARLPYNRLMTLALKEHREMEIEVMTLHGGICHKFLGKLTVSTTELDNENKPLQSPLFRLHIEDNGKYLNHTVFFTYKHLVNYLHHVDKILTSQQGEGVEAVNDKSQNRIE